MPRLLLPRAPSRKSPGLRSGRRCASSSSTAVGSSARRERGRELYLAGHVPGSVLPRRRRGPLRPSVTGQGRHPLPRSSGSRPPRPRAGIGPGVRSSPTGRSAAQSASGGSSATSGTTTAPCSPAGSTPGAGRSRAGPEEIEPGEFVPAAALRRHDLAGGSRCAASATRRSFSSTRARRTAGAASRTSIDTTPGPDPRRPQRAVGGAAARAARGRARRVLRLRCHGVRRAAPGLPPRARGKALSRQLERLVGAGPADRAGARAARLATPRR